MRKLASIALGAGIIASSWAPPEAAARKPAVRFPEDLGPAEIDVSGYPPEHQKTYNDVFVPVLGFLGHAARLANSPLVELDAKLEQAEKSEHPELFADPRIALASKDGWKKIVDALHRRPRCCGACPVLSMAQAKALWRFLVYDSLARKTGPGAQAWIKLRRGLIERFRREYPQEYARWRDNADSTAQEMIQ